MKAFVAECNAFILRTVGEALTAAGYEVYGTLTSASADAPSWLRSADTSLSAWALELSPAQLAEAARKEASVVVYAVHGQEQQCQEAVLQLAALPADGKERVFIGISTPLTWAKTPKPAGQPEQANMASAEADPSTSDIDMFTEQDAELRQPAARALATCEAEHVIIRAARKGRLRTHIICPGLLYGLGETAEGWHEQFQAAWQASPSTSLPVYGSGANIVPTIHVTDLAAYVVACAECGRPDTPYLLAVDQKLHSLREIVAAISGKLGSGLVHEVPQDELFVMKGIERYLLELPMSPTHLPLPPTLHYHDGLLANLDTIAQQYLAARQLAPMKVLLAGPPAAGKTYWADKLAAEYQLRRIDARAMLTAAEELGPAFKQEVQTELSGKGGRASDASLARICQHLLRRLPERNRGYVLDGWPRTAEQAEEVFSMDVPYTEEELRAWESEKANEAAAKGPPAKAGAKGPAAAQKGGKAASIQGPPRRRAVQQELLPDVVFQLDAPEEVLLARVQQVAGVEAAAASPPPPPPAVKGGKAAAPPAAPLSHNNEPGFRRRFAAYTALHETDSQDLHNRQEAIQARWEDQRKALEAKAQAEAETAALAELRQRRKSTLTSSLNASTKTASRMSQTGGHTQSPTPHGRRSSAGDAKATNSGTADGGVPPLPEATSALAPDQGSAAGPSSGSEAAAAPQLGPAGLALQKHLEAGPPQLHHGGLLGFLEEAGTRVVLVGQAGAQVPVAAEADGEQQQQQQQADGSSMEPASAEPTQLAAEVQALQLDGDGVSGAETGQLQRPTEVAIWAEIIGALGRPHNYQGLATTSSQQTATGASPSEATCASNVASASEAGTGLKDVMVPTHPAIHVTAFAADAATAPDDDEPPQQQRHTNVDMWRQHSEEALRFQAEPIRRMLMQDLAPELSAALLEVAGSRPEDPIEFIAQHLIKAGNAREEQYTDPYAADVYATQKQKWLLRQQREALL